MSMGIEILQLLWWLVHLISTALATSHLRVEDPDNSATPAPSPTSLPSFTLTPSSSPIVSEADTTSRDWMLGVFSGFGLFLLGYIITVVVFCCKRRHTDTLLRDRGLSGQLVIALNLDRSQLGDPTQNEEAVHLEQWLKSIVNSLDYQPTGGQYEPLNEHVVCHDFLISPACKQLVNAIAEVIKKPGKLGLDRPLSCGSRLVCGSRQLIRGQFQQRETQLREAAILAIETLPAFRKHVVAEVVHELDEDKCNGETKPTNGKNNSDTISEIKSVPLVSANPVFERKQSDNTENKLVEATNPEFQSLTARLKHRYQQLQPVNDPFTLEGQILEEYYQPLEISQKRNKYATAFNDDYEEAKEAKTDESRDYHFQPSTFLWQPIELEKLWLSRKPTLILQGEVGSGKTTWCQQLVKNWAREKTIASNVPAWLTEYDHVLYLPLRELFPKIMVDDSIADEADKIEAWVGPKLWSHVLKYKVTDKDSLPSLSNVLVILDGFDEVVTMNKRSTAWQVLTRLLDPGYQEQRHVILTTRPQIEVGQYFQAFTQRARVARIQGLSKESQTKFIAAYLGDRREEDQGLNSFLLRESFHQRLQSQTVLKELQYNPLLLKMFCWLYGKPHLRRDFMEDLTLTGIYTKVTQELIIRWRDKEQLLAYFTAQDSERVLYSVLESLADRDETVIERNAVKSTLLKLNIPQNKHEAVLTDLSEQGLGLLKPNAATSRLIDCDWEFLHRSFQEYFQGRHWALQWASLTSATDQLSFIVKLADEHRSTLAVQFAVGGISQLAMDNSTKKVFAQQCIQTWLNSYLAMTKAHRERLLSSFQEVSSQNYTRILVEVSPTLLRVCKPPRCQPNESIIWFKHLVGTGHWPLVKWGWEHLESEVKKRCLRGQDSVLFTAIRSGGFKIIHKLLELLPSSERIALLKQKNQYGESIVQIAETEGQMEFIQQLQELLPSEEKQTLLEQINEDGIPSDLLKRIEQGALYKAAKEGYVAFAWQCFDQLSESEWWKALKQPDATGTTILQLAARYNQIAFGKMILEKSFPLSFNEPFKLLKYRDKFGRTVMHEAAKEGHVGFAQMLLEALPPFEQELIVSERTRQGESLLHMAAWGGHITFSEWYLNQFRLDMKQRSVELKQTNKHGETALYIAADEGNWEFGRWLIRQIPDQYKEDFILKENIAGENVFHPKSRLTFSFPPPHVFPPSSQRTNQLKFYNELLAYLPEEKRQTIFLSKTEKESAPKEVSTKKQQIYLAKKGWQQNSLGFLELLIPKAKPATEESKENDLTTNSPNPAGFFSQHGQEDAGGIAHRMSSRRVTSIDMK